MLNSARCVLSEMIFEDEVSKVIVKDCCADLLDAIVKVATISCGCDEWSHVYSFLVTAGISIPDDFNYKMMYMETIADLPPFLKSAPSRTLLLYLFQIIRPIFKTYGFFH